MCSYAVDTWKKALNQWNTLLKKLCLLCCQTQVLQIAWPGTVQFCGDILLDKIHCDRQNWQAVFFLLTETELSDHDDAFPSSCFIFSPLFPCPCSENNIYPSIY